MENLKTTQVDLGRVNATLGWLFNQLKEVDSPIFNHCTKQEIENLRQFYIGLVSSEDFAINAHNELNKIKF